MEKELVQGYGILTPPEDVPPGLYLIRVNPEKGAGPKIQKVLWQ